MESPRNANRNMKKELTQKYDYTLGISLHCQKNLIYYCFLTFIMNL